MTGIGHTMPQQTRDEKLMEELSRRGLRATRQRVATLRMLRRIPGHPTVADLHRRLLPGHATLSQKTVYEILDALVAAGLASRVTAGGEPYRYEARPEPHYHASCRVCGRLIDLPASADAQIQGRAQLPEGFRVERIEVLIRGLCQRCRTEI
jgi:Fe2+ or Zn2+ uptake regulation protein